jgi:hypothetical protein
VPEWVGGGQKISSPGTTLRFAPRLTKIFLVFLFLDIHSKGTYEIFERKNTTMTEKQF